ncbi:hypothetical protein TNCT_723631 [Trichonephila clavata]|uniref:Uncharacterized protein n=1 Tax=Trichonephila clavata TaxID=2740835 RepID=A0A8X6KCB9_TRICU|nr:hypothetical protein TNCT_723631 [Trichonephila clavata]
MTFVAQKLTISLVVKTAYSLYFRVKVSELRKPWAPNLVTHSVDMPIPDPPKKYETAKDYVEEEDFIKPGHPMI